MLHSFPDEIGIIWDKLKVNAGSVQHIVIVLMKSVVGYRHFPLPFNVIYTFLCVPRLAPASTARVTLPMGQMVSTEEVRRGDKLI